MVIELAATHKSWFMTIFLTSDSLTHSVEITENSYFFGESNVLSEEITTYNFDLTRYFSVRESELFTFLHSAIYWMLEVENVQ